MLKRATNEIPVYADRQGQIAPESSLDVLGLSVRVYYALRRSSIKYVGELLQLRDSGGEGLYLVRNMGQKGVAEVNAALERFEIVDTLSLPDKPDVQIVYVISPEVISWQASLIERQILVGTLHREAVFQGQTIGQWLAVAHEEAPDRMFLVFADVLGSTLTLCDELEKLLQSRSKHRRDPARELFILLKRFHPADKLTLQQIADQLGVSRERVRQLQKQCKQALQRRVPVESATIRIQSALLRARDKGEDLTWSQWREDVITSGLCGRWQDDGSEKVDPLDLMLAICKALGEDHPLLALPEHLHLALQLRAEGRPDTPVRELLFERSIPQETRRLIQRHYQHSGAVSTIWLCTKLGISREEVEEILRAVGFKPLARSWYQHIDAPDEKLRLSKSDVFHKNLHKMFKCCGPLDEEDLHYGLRNALSRPDFPAPPPPVLRALLNSCGYAEQDGQFFVEGSVSAQLSDSEQLIVECIRDKGTVVSYAELVEMFDKSKLSRAALIARLQNSPLFDKADKALYHLRGARYTREDLQRARATSKRSSSVNDEWW